MNVDEIVEKLKEEKDILKELDKLREDNIPTDTIAEARKKLIEKVKERTIVKLKKTNSPEAKYNIVYDSIGRGLEPFYFWLLDFMRNPAVGMEVNKVQEEFEATAGGGYFGDLGAKASAMQDRAISLMERVNAVVRTIINLIYDLKDFKTRLEIYDHANKSEDKEEKQAGEYALRGIWMDQVDIKEGRGSINNLTSADLQFVTLRDAFLQAIDLKNVDKMDLNKRVKIIIKQKLEKYLIWRKASEAELTKRYNIERNYLKAQVDSLKIYTKWARPYLRAAQKLGMSEFTTKSKLPAPEMVTAFNNMMMELSLFGKKEIKPEAVHDSYKKNKFSTKYYACVDINMKFRTLPQAMQGERGSHFVHTGVIDLTFIPYAMTEEEINLIETAEVYEDLELVENLTKTSLTELQADIDSFLINKDETPKKEEKNESLFGNPLKGLQEILQNIGFSTGFFKHLTSSDSNSFMVGQVTSEAKKIALEKCLTIYKVFKKSHRMTQW